MQTELTRSGSGSGAAESGVCEGCTCVHSMIHTKCWFQALQHGNGLCPVCRGGVEDVSSSEDNWSFDIEDREQITRDVAVKRAMAQQTNKRDIYCSAT